MKYLQRRYYTLLSTLACGLPDISNVNLLSSSWLTERTEKARKRNRYVSSCCCFVGIGVV